MNVIFRNCQGLRSKRKELQNYLLEQGGHKPGKHGKPEKLREFEKLSKSQGNFNFCRKTWKTQGK